MAKCEELASTTIETHLTLKVLEHFTKLDLEVGMDRSR